jgi:toxin-antitoxin system PIN domain toxin
MTYLFDVNVLMALAWPNHVHHELAHRWFRQAQPRFATCPLTQLGFVRISSNPQIIPDAVSPREALDLLTQIVGRPHHEFWADAIEPTQAMDALAISGHKQLTDAYLLCLAEAKHGKLVTLDKRFAAFASGAKSLSKALEVIL